MSAKNRCRGPNFTREEQLLLFNILEPYTKVIECKKTGCIKLADKHNAWAEIAEAYNANTRGVPRSVENLISCYRNAKSKLKKKHSEAKMLFEDTSKQEEFLNSLEEKGKDWEVTVQIPADICQNSFLKKEDDEHKTNISGAGGGPPSNDDDPLIRIKKFIDPEIDGLHNVYDGDAELMGQFQRTKPLEEQTNPIQTNYLQPNSISDFKTPLPNSEIRNRAELLRRKNWSGAPSSSKLNKTVNESFVTLAKEKLELVKLQKEVLENDLEHKKNIYELELEEKIKANKFNEEMRQKALILMDLKIKKEEAFHNNYN